MTIFTDVSKEDCSKLLKKGFTTEPGRTAYEQARFIKKDLVLVLYTSGKLLMQGKPAAVTLAAKLVRSLKIGRKEKNLSFKKETGWINGSDETLKRDNFGGMVVAAVKANDEVRKKLTELGVQDSKNLSDTEIPPLADAIKKIAPCEIISLLPEEYNKSHHHQTELLNKLHTQVAQYLAPGKHIVDKYPGCIVGQVQEEHAESKYVEVAAASILARAAALQQLNYLSSLAGFALPKGSTHISLGLLELQQRGLEFKHFVKMDFRNVQEFL